MKQVTDKYHIPYHKRPDRYCNGCAGYEVHIGQHDLPAAAVRKVIGGKYAVGSICIFHCRSNTGTTGWCRLFGSWRNVPYWN
ncbi:MAG: hypothetical protein ACLTQL_11195 [Eisenbergiella sp.]